MLTNYPYQKFVILINQWINWRFFTPFNSRGWALACSIFGGYAWKLRIVEIHICRVFLSYRCYASSLSLSFHYQGDLVLNLWDCGGCVCAPALCVRACVGLLTWCDFQLAFFLSDLNRCFLIDQARCFLWKLFRQSARSYFSLSSIAYLRLWYWEPRYWCSFLCAAKFKHLGHLRKSTALL